MEKGISATKQAFSSTSSKYLEAAKHIHKDNNPLADVLVTMKQTTNIVPAILISNFMNSHNSMTSINKTNCIETCVTTQFDINLISNWS
jgi:hypothetical protein